MCLLFVGVLAFAGGEQEKSGAGESEAAGSAEESGGSEQASEEGGDYVIALSNSYFGNAWRKQMVDAFEEAAEKAKADGRIKDYIVVNGDGTQNQQIAQMNSLILKGVDAICINSASPTALNGVIEKAHDAGIEVLAFDSIATSPYCYKLDFNFVEQTEWGTQWIADKIGGEGNIIVVRGVSGSVPDQQMYQGQQNVLEKYPEMEVVAEVIGEASTTVTQQAVSNVLPSLPAVDAVVTQGGGDAWGVVQAFQASMKEMPIIIGDNTAEFLNWWWEKYQEDGYETVSVCSAPTIGGAALWLSLNILEQPEGAVPEKMSLGVIPITVDNLENYLDTKPGTLAAPTFTEDWVVENLIEKYSNN